MTASSAGYNGVIQAFSTKSGSGVEHPTKLRFFINAVMGKKIFGIR
jgi:hypothetical protein